MIKEVLYAVIVLLGIPVGIFLSKLCGEEISAWTNRLKFISIIAFILGIAVWFMDFEYKIPVAAALSFVIVNNLVITLKGGRK